MNKIMMIDEDTSIKLISYSLLPYLVDASWSHWLWSLTVSHITINLHSKMNFMFNRQFNNDLECSSVLA